MRLSSLLKKSCVFIFTLLFFEKVVAQSSQTSPNAANANLPEVSKSKLNKKSKFKTKQLPASDINSENELNKSTNSKSNDESSKTLPDERNTVAKTEMSNYESTIQLIPMIGINSDQGFELGVIGSHKIVNNLLPISTPNHINAEVSIFRARTKDDVLYKNRFSLAGAGVVAIEIKPNTNFIFGLGLSYDRKWLTHESSYTAAEAEIDLYVKIGIEGQLTDDLRVRDEFDPINQCIKAGVIFDIPI